MPRLSFVIPTHNRREMLLAAVDSVHSQTLDDWELIIVDDGSAEPVRNYVNARDQRVTVHRNDSPLGAAASEILEQDSQNRTLSHFSTMTILSIRIMLRGCLSSLRRMVSRLDSPGQH